MLTVFRETNIQNFLRCKRFQYVFRIFNFDIFLVGFLEPCEIFLFQKCDFQGHCHRYTKSTSEMGAHFSGTIVWKFTTQKVLDSRKMKKRWQMLPNSGYSSIKLENCETYDVSLFQKSSFQGQSTLISQSNTCFNSTLKNLQSSIKIFWTGKIKDRFDIFTLCFILLNLSVFRYKLFWWQHNKW